MNIEAQVKTLMAWYRQSRATGGDRRSFKRAQVAGTSSRFFDVVLVKVAGDNGTESEINTYEYNIYSDAGQENGELLYANARFSPGNYHEFVTQEIGEVDPATWGRAFKDSENDNRVVVVMTNERTRYNPCDDDDENNPPEANEIPPQSTPSGSEVSFVISGYFTEADPNDVLTFSAENLPTGLTIIAETGVIEGTATDPDGTQYLTRVIADDGNGGMASTQFDWFIEEMANQAPIQNGTIPDQTDTRLDLISRSFSSYFEDPDGDDLTFTATGLPAGLSISSAGLVTGTIVGPNPFTYTPNITATDPDGLFVDSSFTWNVLEGD